MAYVEATNDLTADKDSAELVIRGMDDFLSLSQVDKARFNGLLYNIVTKYFVARQYYKQGDLTQQDIDSYDEALAQLILSPGVMQWWNITKGVNPQFVQDLIDDIVRSHPKVIPYSELLKFQAPNATRRNRLL